MWGWSQSSSQKGLFQENYLKAKIKETTKIKKTPEEIRVYLMSLEKRKDNKAVKTLKKGVNIKTNKPKFNIAMG
jgi:hypothetical protein